MKFRIKLFLELTISMFIVFLLAGCFGDGGSSNAYDGTWTAVFTDTSGTLPPAASGLTVTCVLPTTLPTVTLENGIGSTIQRNPCFNTAVTPLNIDYLISINIKASTGALSAIVNGVSLSGQCISTQGCAAQAGNGTLSLTR
jgi:hypothetical protein